jgi:hypothetical protein
VYGLERIPPRWLLVALGLMVCYAISNLLSQGEHLPLWVLLIAIFGWASAYRASVRRVEREKADSAERDATPRQD